MTITEGGKRVERLSQAADLVLKGGGLLAMAAIPATVAFKASMLILIIPLIAAALTLGLFGGFLFMLAAVRLEDVFLNGARIPSMMLRLLTYALAATTVYSMMGLVLYFLEQN